MVVLLHRQLTERSETLVPVRYALKVPQNGTLVDLKNALSKLSGVRAENMLIADVFDGRLYEVYGNNKSLVSIAVDNALSAYEIDEGSPSVLAFVSHTVDIPEQFDNRYIGFSFVVSAPFSHFLLSVALAFKWTYPTIRRIGTFSARHHWSRRQLVLKSADIFGHLSTIVLVSQK